MKKSQENKIPEKSHRINRDIRASEVRVISATGENLGVMQTRDAMRIAEDGGLDLIEINSNGATPVCRIGDYGKFLYDAKKREAEARKNQKETEVKLMKFRPVIDDHDFETKVKTILRFLTEGKKVSVMMVFRGREITHQEIGMNVMTKIIEKIQSVGRVESPPRLSGKNMMMMLQAGK